MATRLATTKEKENYARLSRAIVDVMTTILRDIILLYVLPAQIEQGALRLRSSSLRNLRPDQWILIHRASINGYKDFDITILYALLRNICTSIPAPSNGWGKHSFPQTHEITLGDDIERIRLTKNMLQSHIPITDMPDREFEDTWKMLRDLCFRMDNRYTKSYTGELDYIKTCCMDATLRRQYIGNLRMLTEDEYDNRCRIIDNNVKIRNIQGIQHQMRSEVRFLRGETVDNTKEIAVAKNDIAKHLRDVEFLQERCLETQIETKKEICALKEQHFATNRQIESIKNQVLDNRRIDDTCINSRENKSNKVSVSEFQTNSPSDGMYE